jgi:hypothetical protein
MAEDNWQMINNRAGQHSSGLPQHQIRMVSQKTITQVTFNATKGEFRATDFAGRQTEKLFIFHRKRLRLSAVGQIERFGKQGFLWQSFCWPEQIETVRAGMIELAAANLASQMLTVHRLSEGLKKHAVDTSGDLVSDIMFAIKDCGECKHEGVSWNDGELSELVADVIAGNVKKYQ